MAAAADPPLSSLMAPLKPIGESVPNNLTETRIFSHLKDHHLLKARPKAVHFEGYKVGKLHQQTLSLVNGSPDTLSFHIIPPTTQYFKIVYHKKRSKLMPGLGLSISVQFKPDQWKYYYDCVRVHCKGNENILIPIHAYPAMDVSDFPRSVTFQPTPIGQTRSHLLTLQSGIPVDFEYKLEQEETHPAFTVAPMNGTVSGNGKTNIRVTFAPTEFATAVMKLKLEVSQFNSKPVYCTFTGTSTPGLGTDLYKEKQKLLHKAAPVKAPPTKVSTKKQKARRVILSSKEQSEVIYEGVRFPPNLYTPTAVSHVLNQEPGKLKVSQLRQASSRGAKACSSNGDNRESSGQLKETVFIKRVKEKADNEAKNKIKWVTQLGYDLLSEQSKDEIIKERGLAQKIYRTKSHIMDSEETCKQKSTVCIKRKTWRTVYSNTDTGDKTRDMQSTDNAVLFDILSNDLWDTKHKALQRFVAAARTVIVRNRCQAKLEKLKELVRAVKRGETITDTRSAEDGSLSQLLNLSFSPLNLKRCVFPEYKVDSRAVNTTIPMISSNTPIPTTPVQINTTPNITMMELRVPEQYKLLGYSKLLVPSKNAFTIPDIEERPLLTGAEDEYQDLTPIPGVHPSFIPSPLLAKGGQTKQPLTKDKKTDDRVNEVNDIIVEDTEECLEVIPLIPPPSMFVTPNMAHRIHNPCPSVVAGLRPMIPNSEVTYEHNLLPLPSPTLAPHPQPFLDPEDGISGIMKWKQFNSPFLSCLDDQTDLASSWQPILSDTVSSDLLPMITDPEQFTGQQEGDLFDNNMNSVPQLTEDMLCKDFLIPSASTDESASLCQRQTHEVSLLQHHKELLNEVGKLHEDKNNQIIQMITPQNNTKI